MKRSISKLGRNDQSFWDWTEKWVDDLAEWVVLYKSF